MLKIIALGKIKEKYYIDAIAEYVKRIGRFDQIKIIELEESNIVKNASQKDIDNALSKEADLILSKINPRDYVFVLAIEGKLVSSTDLEKEIQQVKNNGYSDLVFIIGSSFGLSKKVKSKANQLISFGRITLPHQLIRVVLTEQIYRALTISTGITYHK